MTEKKCPSQNSSPLPPGALGRQLDVNWRKDHLVFLYNFLLEVDDRGVATTVNADAEMESHQGIEQESPRICTAIYEVVKRKGLRHILYVQYNP